MEDNNRNLILATVLSFLVILVWYTFFTPETPETVTSEQPAVSEPATPTATAGASLGAEQQAAAPETQNAPRIAIESPSLDGSISLVGGRLDDLKLTKFDETLDPTSPNVRLMAPSLATASPELDAEGAKPYYAVYGWIPATGTDPNHVPNPATVWTLESGETLAPGQPVTIAWDNGAGQIFRRSFELDEEYLFTVTQSVENTGDATFNAAPYGIIARHGEPDLQNIYVLHEGAIAMNDGNLTEIDYDDITDLDRVNLEGRAEILEINENGWVGFTDKYWMTNLIAKPGSPFTAVVKYAEGADIYQTEARFPVQSVTAGASAEVGSYLFAGAKEWEVIKGYQDNLGVDRFVDSIDWGWFYFLTKPIFRLLHFLNGFIGNMGWAIIGLTFVLKLLVFPLARKSYISMAKMKELQPEMEKLKERAGDDRQKMQKEMMELYKREKVNPAAGCLPILLQIPIFFSLYKVIFVTIELRHAPWVGWIRDLSAPDPSTLWNLFGLFPWDAPVQGTILHSFSLPVLAILLGVSMWMQQRLNPTPTDPTQKMIFAWMPWIFMFMLGGFASGLVLYWITNNVITIGQQYAIMSMHGQRPDLFGNIKASLPAKPTKKKGEGKK